MPYIRIWVHFIWTTKNREKIITKDLKHKLLNHIKENSIKKMLFIDTMECVGNHIHNIVNCKFEWQDDYIAVSVSDSVVDKVRDYIRNQEEHHSKKSFAEEYELFLKKYGLKNIYRK